MAAFFPKTVALAVRHMGWRAVADTLRYNAVIRFKSRRFAPKKQRGRFEGPGKVVAVEQHPHGAVFQAERGYVEIAFLSPEIVRVRMRQENDFPPPFSYAIEKLDWPLPAVLMEEDRQVSTLRSEQLVCRVHKNPYRLVVETADGRAISEDGEGLTRRGSEVRWARRLPEDERCYGLGQRASALNLRGKRLALWNRDPQPYSRGDDPVYYSIPFYLGVRPDRACGILWDNPARGTADLGAANAGEMAFFAEDGELRLYLFAGQTAQDVLKHYTALTGRMPLPPLWALGFHQSRWSYESEEVFRTLAQEFRQRRLPCDVLHFDIDTMDGFRCFTWDRKRFPLLPTLLSDLTHQGFQAVAILDPGIKVDPNYAVYQDGVRQDVFLKYPDGKRIAAPVWPGSCHFPDFTSPLVRAWWADQLAALAQAGFAGFWNDMNEPALITLRPGDTLPDYVGHDWDGAGQTHRAGGHNVYGMLMARATREGAQRHRPDRRPFVMTRAAYAGAQRYTSSWTGDNVATWDHLRLSLSMVLNLGLAGMPFTGPDVGGFAGTPDGELFARWMQLGSMLPYFRVHSAKGKPPQEPWRYGERYESINRMTLERRYQLLPYLYSAVARCAQDGTPIARPMFMADPGDAALRDLDDQFMLGDALLVAPVLEPGAVERTLYLPRGLWYEYATGKLMDGAQHITAVAPPDALPLYMRAGQVIPLWPVMQYVGERPLDELRLRVYAGNGETTVYEDAGEGLAYQQGDYRWSYFTCKFLPSGQFILEWRRAGRYQPPYQQVRVEIVGISGEPESVMLDGQGAPVWYYEGGIVELVAGAFGEVRIIGQGGEPGLAEDTLLRPPRRSS